MHAELAEVLSQGEVADVEEIEGIRVLMNEQKRPMVQYLVKWKVCGASRSSIVPPSLSVASCHPFLTCLPPPCRMAHHTPGALLKRMVWHAAECSAPVAVSPVALVGD